MEHISNDPDGNPNQHENRYKLCDETGHPVVNLMESQWKLKSQLIRIDQNDNFPLEGKPL